MTFSALSRTDPGYSVATTGFQTAHPHRPDLVVAARTPDEVMAAVRHAARTGTPIAVQATGHGRRTGTTDGMLISTRGLTELSIDPSTRLARIGAGVTARQVIDAAARHRLAPLNGSSPGVGMVGYHLGGGLGILARSFGWAADRVGAIDLVTVDGTLRRLTAQDELFGAVLGSGGAFGVVTALEVELLPVATVVGGQLTFTAAAIPEAAQAWREWTAELPDSLTSAFTTIVLPRSPAVPEHLQGQYLATVNIAHVGPEAEGQALLRPLRAIGGLVGDTVAALPYVESDRIYRDPEDPHGYAAGNAMLSALTERAVTEFLAATGPEAEVPTVAGFRQLGGALALPGPAWAVGHRNAAYLSRWITDPPDEAVTAQHRRLQGLFAAHTLGRQLNLLYGAHSRADPEQDRDCYDADTYRRLVTLKADLDPAELLRGNRRLR